MTQEESQRILSLSDKNAEKALAISDSSIISKTAASASPSCDHTSTLQTNEKPKIQPSQLQGNTEQLPLLKGKEAKRTPSNLSSKSVTFCLKYIYAWYPPAVDIDLVSRVYSLAPFDVSLVHLAFNFICI